MVEVTLEQLRKFILAQKNTRKVNLYEGNVRSDTGCLLNHYCKSHKIKFTGCTFQIAVFNAKTVLLCSEHVTNLFHTHVLYLKNVRTYGELKTYLRNETI